jgi:hypothetical protein
MDILERFWASVWIGCFRHTSIVHDPICCGADHLEQILLLLPQKDY